MRIFFEPSSAALFEREWYITMERGALYWHFFVPTYLPTRRYSYVFYSITTHSSCQSFSQCRNNFFHKFLALFFFFFFQLEKVFFFHWLVNSRYAEIFSFELLVFLVEECFLIFLPNFGADGEEHEPQRYSLIFSRISVILSFSNLKLYIK